MCHLSPLAKCKIESTEGEQENAGDKKQQRKGIKTSAHWSRLQTNVSCSAELRSSCFLVPRCSFGKVWFNHRLGTCSFIFEDIHLVLTRAATYFILTARSCFKGGFELPNPPCTLALVTANFIVILISVQLFICTCQQCASLGRCNMWKVHAIAPSSKQTNQQELLMQQKEQEPSQAYRPRSRPVFNGPQHHVKGTATRS